MFFFFFFFFVLFFSLRFPYLQMTAQGKHVRGCCATLFVKTFSLIFLPWLTIFYPPSPTPFPQYQTLVFSLLFIFFFYYATLIEWASLPNIVRTATLTVFFSLPFYTHTCIVLGRKKKVKKNLIPNFCCNQCHVSMFSTQWRLQMSFQRWLVFIRNILTIRKVRRNF